MRDLRRWLLLAVALSAAACSSRADAEPVAKKARAPTGPLLIGYNLDYPGDWSQAMPFIDLMHDARPWAGSVPERLRAQLDAQGWPMDLRTDEALTSIVHTNGGEGFVGRVWVLRWEGTGVVTIDGSVKVLDAAPGRVRFRGGDDNVWVTVRSTPVKNVTIVREDRLALHAQGAIFNPDLMDLLASYRAVRFMDWGLTNSMTDTQGLRWLERSRPTQPQWLSQYIDPARPELGKTNTGYPVEIMVELANQTKAHPYFNMPTRSSDETVRGFATLVRDTLAPGLVATVEYSNEVWNWGFPQATYARLEGEKRWPGDKAGWVQFMGVRASQVCSIWKEVFVGQEHRLRCVIAPQTGWIDIAPSSLDCPNWVKAGHPPCHRAADAIAITGYFGTNLARKENAETIKGWLAVSKEHALEQAFRFLQRGDVPGLKNGDETVTAKNADSVQNAVGHFRKWKRIADERGLELIAYEGGTHFDHGEDPVIKEFLLDVSRDARMEGLYRELFEGFHAAGGTVFHVWGGIGTNSAWANATSLTDRAHPKFRAVAPRSVR